MVHDYTNSWTTFYSWEVTWPAYISHQIFPKRKFDFRVVFWHFWYSSKIPFFLKVGPLMAYVSHQNFLFWKWFPKKAILLPQILKKVMFFLFAFYVFFCLLFMFFFVCFLCFFCMLSMFFCMFLCFLCRFFWTLLCFFCMFLCMLSMFFCMLYVFFVCYFVCFYVFLYVFYFPFRKVTWSAITVPTHQSPIPSVPA